MKNRKFKALNHCVIIKEIEMENKTESGIVIAHKASADQKQSKGVIVSAGLGCPKKSVFSRFLFFWKRRSEVNTVKEGDTVIFDRYKSTNMTVDAVEYQMVYYSDLILVFE